MGWNPTPGLCRRGLRLDWERSARAPGADWACVKEAEVEEEDKDEERSRFGGFPAGTASESTNTSPRMCSTYWAGTPGGLTGWVNTMCTPVAVTVSSPALFVPGPGPNWKVVFDDESLEPFVEVVADWLFVPVPLPPFVHMLVEGAVPDWSHELVGVVVVLDRFVVVVVVVVFVVVDVPGRAGAPPLEPVLLLPVPV